MFGGINKKRVLWGAVCTAKIFLREGALLRIELEFLAGGVTVGPTNVPVISGYAHGGEAWVMRWDGL